MLLWPVNRPVRSARRFHAYADLVARQRLRFAFTLTEGPNAGLSCSGWRLWVNREDTYITAKSLEGKWKTSLHGDEAWQHAVTIEHLRSPNPVYNRPDRAAWKFTPTVFQNGGRLAFVIAVTRGALLPQTADAREHHIPVADRWDQVTKACVWMTEPDVDFASAMLLGGPLRLASGRRVWLAYGVEMLPGGNEPEEPCIGAMVQPMSPEADGVAAPGLLLRGVRWSHGIPPATAPAP